VYFKKLTRVQRGVIILLVLHTRITVIIYSTTLHRDACNNGSTKK